MKYPYLGIVKTVYEIERCLYKSNLYTTYITLTDVQKEYLRRKFTWCIQKYILKDMWTAVAKDVLRNDMIDTSSNVFKYLNVYIFKGNTRKFLVFLQDVLNEKKGK